ncbi:MAG: hypothetical protein KatS3mg083_126 [Candidatus Dojkabacteria bacterium]|nr:MAG: hypothetical protein KatS3mg083_126 [Candidatus Dojkabacteria bacterium]
MKKKKSAKAKGGKKNKMAKAAKSGKLLSALLGASPPFGQSTPGGGMPGMASPMPVNALGKLVKKK